MVDNPPGFFIDEAIHGYEAHSLFTTGLSSNGELLPRLFMPLGATNGIRDHGNYPYYIVPFIVLFGYNEFAVRITSVAFSLGLLWVIYQLVKDRVSRPAFILVAVSWPFISWVFLTARMGMEESAYAFISMLIIFLLVKMIESKKSTTLQVVLLGLSISALFYIYAAGKLLSLLYIPLALVVLFKRSSWSQRVAFVSIIGFGFSLSIPYVLDGSFFYRGDEITKCFEDSCLIPHIASHFSFSNYFENSYIPKDFFVHTHSITGTPLLPVYFIPFLFIGVWFVAKAIRKKDRLVQILVISFFLATIPASLTVRGFDSYRSVAVLPILVIVIIFGVDKTMRFFAEWWDVAYRILYIILFMIVTTAGFQQYTIFMQYKFHVDAASYSGWQFGYGRVMDYIISQYDKYDNIFVTKFVAYGPDIYIKYFDPEEAFPKVKIGSLANESAQGTLFVIRPFERKNNFIVKKTIYYPNNKDVAFYIGEKR